MKNRQERQGWRAGRHPHMATESGAKTNLSVEILTPRALRERDLAHGRPLIGHRTLLQAAGQGSRGAGDRAPGDVL